MILKTQTNPPPRITGGQIRKSGMKQCPLMTIKLVECVVCFFVFLKLRLCHCDRFCVSPHFIIGPVEIARMHLFDML